MWRFRGTPHYLALQAKRLGICPVLANQARHSKDIYRVSVLLGQLCERYYRIRQRPGVPTFEYQEREQVRASLESAENDLAKLHVLAATAEMMLDEAYAAFELPTPARSYAILSDLDGPGRPFTLPLGDGTVGAPDGDEDDDNNDPSPPVRGPLAHHVANAKVTA